MTKTPIAVVSTGLADHPAARAWSHLADERPVSIELWRDVTLTKPAIHRLAFDRGRHPAVYAKQCPRSSLDLERQVYEEILPHLPITAASYYGFHLDSDGTGWLFTEDVGGRRLSRLQPAERVLAARWLGRLHGSAADLPAARRLPDAGPARYLAHLRLGREKILEHFGNPGLGPDDQAILRAVLEQYDALEARWDDIERVCADLPTTMVHGDFKPRNVRIRTDGGNEIVCPIDWEMAGWGVPATDLVSGRRPGQPMLVDPQVYEGILRKRWALDASVMRKLSSLGNVLWALAGIAWETAGLIFESPRSLLETVSSIHCFSTRLSNGLEAGREWLG